jgi:NAD(P)-dependent dehydrogenase (short-subunit alcohol dehydrogenase family)
MPGIGTGGVVGPHYASSKSALHGILHWIAQRYAKEGIVCLVSLLRISTPHSASDMQHSCPRAHRQYVRLARLARVGRLTSCPDTGMIPENREDFAVRVPSRPLPLPC